MVHISVLYPNNPGNRFDWDYYMNKHIAMVWKTLEGQGMVRAEVDKGVASAWPGGGGAIRGDCEHVLQHDGRYAEIAWGRARR